jgi:uncharacterized coiled-coil protein SlyX
LPVWALRAWPVWGLLPAFAGHWLALTAFPGSTQLVNKLVGALLQIVGGLLVLYSVNDNLGLFRRQSLSAAILTWFRSFPLSRKGVTVALSGVASSYASGSGSVSTQRNLTTLEERLAELERTVQDLRKELNSGLAAAQQQLEQAKSELRTRIEAVASQVAELHQKVEHAAVGGFKLQAFGVLLAAYGAVTSVYA